MNDNEKQNFIVTIEGSVGNLPLGFSVGNVGDDGLVIHGFLRGDKGCTLQNLLDAFSDMFSANGNIVYDGLESITLSSADFIHRKNSIYMQAKCSFSLVDNIFFPDSKILSEVKYESSTSVKKLEVSGKLDFIERTFNFCCSYSSGGGAILTANYEAEEEGIDLSTLNDKVQGLSIPKGFKVNIKNATIKYDTAKKYSHFGISSISNKFLLDMGVGSDKATLFLYKSLKTIHFSILHLVGEILKEVFVSDVSLNIASADINQFEDLSGNKVDIPKGVSFSASLNILGVIFPIKFGDFKQVGGEFKSFSNSNGDSENIGYWYDLNKNIGAVSIKRIGVKMQDSTFALMLDSSLTICGIGVSLLGAGLKFTPMDFSSIKPTLSGLGLDINKPPLVISGAFLSVGEFGSVGWSCSGVVSIKYKNIGFVMLGEYSKMSDGSSSIFCFGSLRAEIGGVPAFFVVGLAGGLGLNRQLQMPNINELDSFPLIAAATGAMPADKALDAIKTCILPQLNSYWVAIGVSFTSFNVINGFLLATVRFGNYFEIHLIGSFELSIPTNTPKGKAVAYAKMIIDISYSEQSGLFSIQGKLDHDSYVLATACHLTGGFAVCSWFRGEHKGDFVVTFGGYSSKYSPPAHYPKPDPIGFNWQITNELSAKGAIFFALTPSCVMAGGRLEIVYAAGRLRAWLVAFADFLIEWKPYHYDIEIYVSLGVSYRIDFLFIHITLSLELGASLHIWGPEFAGVATIHLWFISFDIKFGDNSSKTPPNLLWNEFSLSFLPSQNKNLNSSNSSRFIMLSSSAEKQFDEYTFNQSNIDLHIKSVVPLSLVKFDGVEYASDNSRLGVAPMGNGVDLSSILNVKVTYFSENITSKGSLFKAVVAKGDVPAALWDRQKPDKYSNKVINDVLVGIDIVAVKSDSYFFPYSVDLYNLTCGIERILHKVDGGIIYEFIQNNESLSVVKKSINDNLFKRNDIAKKLISMGLMEDIQLSDLSKLSNHLNETFSGNPMIANLVGEG